MYTKTLRKRIALVAVATLGAGVLSVAPAFAAVTITVGANGATSSNTQGLLAGAAAEITNTTSTASMLANGQLSVVTNEGGTTSAVVVSGGYITSCSTTGDIVTLSADKTTCSTDGNNAAGITSIIRPNAVGTPLVIMGKTSNSATTWSTATMLTVSVVASTTVNVFSASKSFFSVEASGIAADSNVDATYTSASGILLVPATRVVNGGQGYFGYDVRDANNNALVGNVIGANVTGPCVVGAGGAGTFNAASSTTAASYFRVDQTTANTPGVCVVTLSVNGVVAATRSFTMQGEVTKIAIDYGPLRLKASTTANAAAVFASALDAAGNAIDNVTLAPETTLYTAGLTTVTSIVTKPGSTVATDNSADITCPAKGAQKIQFKTTNASAVSIKSAVLDVFCAGGIVTYSASFDKASYVSGDIATLTITAKDSAGNLTNDYATTGANVSIAGSNLTPVTAATSVDTFTNGVAKYKFIVGATEGSYQMAVDMPAYNDSTTPQAAVTVAYKIAGSGAVSNADVLKAIVSLIASINKQIAALQKALLKK